MLPRSSQRVAEVIKLANRIAREYELEYVGTEHVLLAIQSEGTGVGAAVLKKRGITAGKLRAEIDKLIKKQMEETWVFGRLPGTPHFKNVVAGAIKQCQDIGAKELCTEHLLLALLLEKGSVACKALKALGLTHDHALADVRELNAAGSRATPG
jgi:ATP-dependent Clp protease ATP-binding subunit ClpC